MADLLNDAIATAIETLLEDDPTWGDQYRRAANRAPFLTAVATNIAGIGVGEVTEAAVSAVLEC